MLKIIDKIDKGIESMNKASKLVIKYGVHAFLVISLISLIIQVYNRYNMNDYLLSDNSIGLFKSSISLLAIAVIGGLVMEFMIKHEM